MGQYCASEAVQVRLEGKVKFDVPGGSDSNKMSLNLLNVLISEAESQLEIDLMDRYDIPFKMIDGTPFSNLPAQTKILLKNLAELISVIRVLETDFGRGTSANGEKYVEKAQKRYDQIVKTLMDYQEQTEKTSRQWRRRPLDGLKVSYNNQGDNGFRGRATNITPTSNRVDYAAEQINNPAENYFNGNAGFWGRDWE